MDLFYHPESGKMGDVIPFWEDGVFHLYYLGKGWKRIDTRDQLHFSVPRETGIRGGTGSVVRDGDFYHLFYCTFSSGPESRQYVCHAVSRDMERWETLPEDTFQPDGQIYEMTDWRDPHVIWNAQEGFWWMLIAARAREQTGRNGCVGLCKSKDLHRWILCPPLYAPHTHPSAHECPDLFQWGNWWYLLYSVYTDRFQTLYRMAPSPEGPWITPLVDTFDTRCFYAAKHGTDGTAHFLYGWNPDRAENIWSFNPQKDYGKDYNTWDWGGTMIVHQLRQNPDGTLGVLPPSAVDHAFPREQALDMQPLSEGWRIGDGQASAETPSGYASLLMNPVPASGKLEMDVSFRECPREFGIALQVETDFTQGYYLIFEPRRQRIQYKTGLRLYEDGGKMFPYEIEMERPFRWQPDRMYHVRVFVQDTILLLYVDDQVALGTRMFNRKGARFGLFVSDGSAAFDHIHLFTE